MSETRKARAKREKSARRKKAAAKRGPGLPWAARAAGVRPGDRRTGAAPPEIGAMDLRP